MQNLEIVTLGGGVDQVTPPLLLAPGKLISALNYEPDINGGYRKMAGYERFDGRQAPSSASYFNLTITPIDPPVAINVGDTITGVLSSATAYVLALNGTTEIIAAVAGTFQDGEDLEVMSVPVGTLVDIVEQNASTVALNVEYKYLSSQYYRGFITAVPGSGPIRGVCNYKGDIYAFRDNVAGTACDMWKATPSGWAQITFGKEVQFDGAVAEIFEGNTVLGFSSGASGVVRRVLLRSGTWTAGGVGTLVFDTITGAFVDNEELRVGGVKKAVANGASTNITLLPGGRFTFDNYNFFASTDGLRMYFVDGVNEIHEFDGTRIVPIRTGITGTSKPTFVVGHRNNLIVSVESSLQVSSTGNPYAWTALTGAAELGLGDTCTGLKPQSGEQTTGVLFALTASKTYVLYGNDTSDFNLVLFSDESGGYPHTVQNIGQAYYLDTQGVVAMKTAQEFGGFELSIATRAIQPFINAKRNLAKASVIVRSKNQYRLFFSDGSGLTLYARPSRNGVVLEPTMFELFPLNDNYMNAVDSFIDNTGKERIFAGCSNGFVYELDSGTSRDGDIWEHSILTAFGYSKSPRDRKRYRRLVVQFEADDVMDVDIGYDLSFGAADPSYGVSTQAQSALGRGAYWDAFTWDNFVWDSPYAQEFNVDTPGTGTSFSVIVSGASKKNGSHKIHTLLLHYLPGRQER